MGENGWAVENAEAGEAILARTTDAERSVNCRTWAGENEEEPLGHEDTLAHKNSCTKRNRSEQISSHYLWGTTRTAGRFAIQGPTHAYMLTFTVCFVAGICPARQGL